MNLVDNLIKDGWLKTPEIIEAFRKIKREDFVPEELKNLSKLNEALPIGSGQTISQPLTVAFMIELLQPKLGDKILDVGSGSGWATALLAYIVRQSSHGSHGRENRETPGGRVIAIELVPELYRFGENNVQRYGFKNIDYILGDGSKGYAKESPYDKILVSAAAERVPEELKKQLKTGGRLVIPIKNSIWLFIKKGEDEFQEKEHPGFVFVPLV